MSDDLERAALGIARLEQFRLLRREPTVGEIAVQYEAHRRVYRTDARAALLSFLDMDEAGVERLAEAIFNASLRDYQDRDALWGLASARDAFKAQARAVLSELRKMAGEKDG